jgi:hypothetical protein
VSHCVLWVQLSHKCCMETAVAQHCMDTVGIHCVLWVQVSHNAIWKLLWHNTVWILLGVTVYYGYS